MKKLIISAFALVALAACNAGESERSGDWKVVPEQSRVAFVTVKNHKIAETHRFRTVEGKVGADGKARFTIELATVDTGVDIRNERMKEFLFEVARYPQAVVTATLDMSKFSAMKVGDRELVPLTMNVELHGATAEAEGQVYVTRTGPNRVLVETAEPIVFEAGDFNLQAGVDKLMALAKLPAIAPVAPATFSIVLAR